MKCGGDLYEQEYPEVSETACLAGGRILTRGERQILVNERELVPAGATEVRTAA